MQQEPLSEKSREEDWRCLSDHAQQNTECVCTRPPSAAEEHLYMLRGEASKKNGEKQLRAQLQRTKEWQSPACRSELAEKLKHERSQQSHLLAKVLQSKDAPSLRKPHLFRLSREWLYMSDIWQLKVKPKQQHASATTSVKGAEIQAELISDAQHQCTQHSKRRRTMPTAAVDAHEEEAGAVAQSATRTNSKNDLSLAIHKHSHTAGSERKPESRAETIARHAAREWRPLMERAIRRLGLMSISHHEYSDAVLSKDDNTILRLHKMLQSNSKELERLAREISLQHTALRREEFMLSSKCDPATTASNHPVVEELLSVTPDSSLTSIENYINTVLHQGTLTHYFEVGEGCHDVLRLTSRLREAIAWARSPSQCLQELLLVYSWAFELCMMLLITLASNANDVVQIREEILRLHRPSLLKSQQQQQQQQQQQHSILQEPELSKPSYTIPSPLANNGNNNSSPEFEWDEYGDAMLLEHQPLQLGHIPPGIEELPKI